MPPDPADIDMNQREPQSPQAEESCDSGDYPGNSGVRSGNSGDCAGNSGGLTRRSFVKTLGLSASAGALTRRLDATLTPMERIKNDPDIVGPHPIKVSLRVNGKKHSASVDPATTLLDALRHDFNLTGTKEVCDRGACGACSVLVDGELVNSCMMLATDAVGAEVTTIEGLANGDQLDPIQESFIRHDALQCGYCIPGMVMAAKALLNKNPRPSLAEIKKGLGGNICRCGAYTNMFNAVLEASGQPVIVDGEDG